MTVRPTSALPAVSPDAPGPQDLARAHVAAVVARCPEAAAYDPDVWVAAVLAHIEPLPANRPSRVLAARRRMQPVRELAPAVARRLQPGAGTQPQPTCPTSCFVTHADDVEVA